MSMRTGTMNVRLENPDGLDGLAVVRAIAEAVDAELAASGERLVRLLEDHWAGFAENVMSPAKIYRGVAYEAEPRT
jgi:hypothetical protein